MYFIVYVVNHVAVRLMKGPVVLAPRLYLCDVEFARPRTEKSALGERDKVFKRS